MLVNFDLTFLSSIFVQMKPALSWVTCAPRKHEVYDPVLQGQGRSTQQLHCTPKALCLVTGCCFPTKQL